MQAHHVIEKAQAVVEAAAAAMEAAIVNVIETKVEVALI
jgi:hypothetical protein